MTRQADEATQAAPSESIRCPHCDAILDTPEALTAGECGCRHRGGWKHGDIILNPASNSLFRGEYNRYSRKVEWVELVAIGQGQSRTPAGAVLLCRTVDGKRTPVVDLGNGDLVAVKAVS